MDMENSNLLMISPLLRTLLELESNMYALTDCFISYTDCDCRVKYEYSAY
jgi:hypothetical protein